MSKNWRGLERCCGLPVLNSGDASRLRKRAVGEEVQIQIAKCRGRFGWVIRALAVGMSHEGSDGTCAAI